MKTLKKIMNGFTVVAVILTVMLAVALVGVRLVGFRAYTVLSGSMEPEYPVGSLIYVRSVDPADLAAGDDITFMISQDTVVTHRIVEVLPDEADPEVIRFRTQGIANEAPDGTPVHCKNIIGSPVFAVPQLGYLASYIQNPPGKYLTIAACAIIMMLAFLPDLFEPDEEEASPESDRPDAAQTGEVGPEKSSAQTEDQG